MSSGSGSRPVLGPDAKEQTVGRFITFEGPEGGGKTLQVEHLKRRLESAGVVVVQTKEPGGTVIGQELRAMLLMPERPAPTATVQALLMSADRAQHVSEVIRPALAAGMVVLCDRYFDSTLAYQGFGEGLDLASLDALTRFATGGLKPDLTFLIDLDVNVGLARRRAAFNRGDGELNRIDRREVGFHERVRAGYLSLARRDPARFFVLDGMQPPEVIAETVWKRVSDLLAFAPVAKNGV